MQSNKAELISEICQELTKGNIQSAATLGKEGYPWKSIVPEKRSMNQCKSLQVFRRDGFMDRYFGMKLVFPGALLLLGELVPEVFPHSATWKSSDSHIVYWELWPAVDHVVPISRGGKDDESNFATTSTLHNSAKAQWLLEELGWELHPPGKIDEWDGMLAWFLSYLEENKEFHPSGSILSWQKIAEKEFPVAMAGMR